MIVVYNVLVVCGNKIVINSQLTMVWRHNPRKVTRYGPLFQILSASGLLVNLVTIEVGCLGHFLPSTVSSLCRVCHLLLDLYSNMQLELPFHAPIRYSMPVHHADLWVF